jgi:hypothetical protein
MKRISVVLVLAVAACRAAPSTEHEARIPGLAALTESAQGTTLVALASGRFAAKRADASAAVTVGARYVDGFTVTRPGDAEASLTLQPRHADGALEARPNGVARYALPSAHAEALIAANRDTAEEIVLIEDAAGARELTYQLSHGQKVHHTRLNAGALEAVDAQGMILLRSAPPQILDAAGRTVLGQYSLTGDLLTVRWPTEGLTYPIAVDPAVTSATGAILALSAGATSSNTHDFGTFPKNLVASSGSFSSPATFTVMSSGAQPITINAINSTNSNNFKTQNISPSLPVVLQPGSTLTFQVYFTAASTATDGSVLNGNITFTTDGTSPTLGLTGTPTAAGNSGAYPPTLKFDQTYVGTNRVMYVDIYPGGINGTLTCSTAPALTGTSASQFTVDTSCTTPISYNGGIVRIPVTYSPFATGSASATLTFSLSSPSTTTYTVSLTGTGIQANLNSSGTVAWGNVRKGVSQSLPAFFSNSGSAYDAGTVAISGPYAADFVLSPTATKAVVPPNTGTDGTWTWPVAFTPSTTSLETATLTYTSSITGTVKTIGLSGTGVFPIVAQPISSDAGSVRKGVTSSMPSFQIKNTGTDVLTLGAPSLLSTFGNPADFQVPSAGTITIAAGASQTFFPKFTPSLVGQETAQAVFSAGDFGSVTVLLSGKGVFPHASASPSTLDFGALHVGTPSSIGVLNIQNDGTASLDINTFSLSSSTTDFVISGTLPTTLPVGSGATFTFVYTPSTTGPNTVTGTFGAGDYGNIAVTLTGSGKLPAATLTSAALDFGLARSGTSVSRSLGISNTGTDTLTVNGYSITGTNAADFTVSPASNTFILEPGNSAAYLVTFKPTTTVAETATLVIDTNAGLKNVVLTGTGTLPVATYSTSALAFGNQRKGTISNPRTVTLTNSGNDVLNVSSFFLSGPNVGDFTVTHAAAPFTVSATGSTTWNVTFSPSTAAAESATLSIVTDLGQKDVALSGSGTFPVVALSTSSIDFGVQQLNTQSTAVTLVLNNTGTDVATVSSKSVGGSHSGDFTVTAPTTVAAGGSGNISVKFTPSVVGLESAPITIVTDAGTLTFFATGTGIAPSVSVSTPSLVFPSQVVGTKSGTQTVTVTNVGTSALTVNAPVLSGTNQADFALQSPPSTPASIAPGASVTFGIAFTPSTTSAETGSLDLFFGGGVSQVSVTLSGTGIGAAATVFPSLVAFGSRRVGSPSSAQGFQLTNGSADVLKVLSYTVTGGSGAFVVSPGSGVVSIQPGQSSLWSATFTPAAAGATSAVLTFNTDHGAFVTSFSGTGTFPTTVVNANLLDLGASPKGVQSAPQSFTVTNAGTDSLSISGWSITGADAADFALGSQNGLTVAAGATSTPIDVRMTPSHVGTESATLHFTTDNGAESVELTGSGIFPNVVISRTSLDFGLVQLGDVAPSQTVVLVNTGTNSSLVTMSLTGAQAAAFSVTGSGTSLTLAPGQTASWTVVFGPIVTGVSAATLAFQTDSGRLSVALSGTGGDVFPVAGLAPDTLNFSPLRVGTTEASQSLTLTNSGTADLHVASYALAGAAAADFAVTPGSGAKTIAPGASFSWSVSYVPTVARPSSANITFTTDGGVVSASLNGLGQFPTTTVSPTQLAFGNVRKATASAAQTVTISNGGNSSLGVSSVTVTGTDAADFTLSTPSVPFNIATGGSNSVFATFRPSKVGVETASVVITTDNGSQTVTLTGSGTFPAVAWSTTALAFGSQRRNTATAGRVVTLTNTGTDSLGITGFAVTGANAADFSVSPASGGSTLAAGVPTSWTVVFTPSALGAESATLTFTTDLGTQDVALSGTGVAPTIAAAPTSLSFSAQAKGSLSDPKQVTLTNNGTDSLAITGFTLSGSNSADFVVSPGSQAVSLAAGASATWSVRFAPTTGTNESASLTFASEAGGATIALTGVGINAPLTITPVSANLGESRVFTTSDPTTFTITNVASQNYTVQSFTFSGTNAAEFTVVGNPSARTLAPGTSFSIQAVFTPTTSGPRTATLSVATSDLSTTLQVPLTARGISSVLTIDPPSFDFGPVVVNVSVPQPIHITNSGTDAMVVSNIALTAGSSAFTVADLPPLPITVQPGFTTTFTVIYKPTDMTTSTTSVVVTTDSPLGATGTLPVSGTGISPTLTNSGLSLNFGSVRVGSSGGVRVFTITNSGTLNATVQAVRLSGPAMGDFKILSEPTEPFVLAAGSGSATIAFGFTPTAHGSRTATATLTTNATSAAIQVSLSGVGIEPALNVSPTMLDYGVFALGGVAVVQPVVVKNDGDTVLHLAAPVIDGSGAAAWSVQAPTDAVAIDPGASATLPVSFLPGSAGTLAATLHLKSSDTDALTADITLNGISVAPGLTVPDGVEFGLLSVGEKSAPKTITLTNNSSAELIITDLRSDTPEFVVSSDALPITLAGLSSLSPTVVFSPLTSGVRLGHVQVYVQGQGTALATVALGGTGQILQTTAKPGGCASAEAGPAALLLAALALVGLSRRRRSRLA